MPLVVPLHTEMGMLVILFEGHKKGPLIASGRIGLSSFKQASCPPNQKLGRTNINMLYEKFLWKDSNFWMDSVQPPKSPQFLVSFRHRHTELWGKTVALTNRMCQGKYAMFRVCGWQIRALAVRLCCVRFRACWNIAGCTRPWRQTTLSGAGFTRPK